jgi:hypothetical protein
MAAVFIFFLFLDFWDDGHDLLGGDIRRVEEANNQ